MKVGPRTYMIGNGVFMDTLKALGKKALLKVLPMLKSKAVEFAKEQIPKLITKKSQDVIKKLLRKKEATPSNTISTESQQILSSLLRPDPLMLGEGLKLLK